jgi:hypothetical protein
MPVIECACGMVMSVARAEPRTRCIRCGGVEFRLVENWHVSNVQATPFVPRRMLPTTRPAACELSAGVTAANSVSEGACI